MIAGSADGSVPRRFRGWAVFSVLGLVVLATWTVVIKFLVPVLWATAAWFEGSPGVRAPIMWDFWWVMHLGLAWMIGTRSRWTVPSGLTIAAAEVAIVVVKLALFLRAPEFSFWRLLWLTNKLFVLALFVVILVLLVFPGYRRAIGGSGGGVEA